MPNVDAIANIDAVADQQKFLSDPDSRIRIVLQIRIREANKPRIRPDPNHTWSFLWPQQTVGIMLTMMCVTEENPEMEF
jgi:hypothetical protein